MPDLGDGTLTWLDAPADVLHFRRGSVACLVNLSAVDVAVPAGSRVLLASGPVDRAVAPDTAVWLASDA